MAFSAAAKSSLEKLKQGPLQVTWDYAGTPVEMFVNGGVSLNLIRGQEAAETDLIGTYDLYTTGDSATFELNMPETSHEVLQVALSDSADGTSYMGFGQSAGVSARASAVGVRMRPWTTRTAATLQLELWLVSPEGDMVQSMTKSEPWAVTQTFRAFPDLTKANGELIGKLTYPTR